MLLWGLAIGFVGALVLLAATPEHWLLIPFRRAGLRDSLAMIEHGGPLLLGRNGNRHEGSLYNVSFGDDEGIYVYIPLLARLFGVGSPAMIIRYCYVGLVSLTAIVYPSIFYRLTRSLLAGFAAPIALLACIMSMGYFDVYWIPAWAALALLPLLYLLVSDWPRLGLALLLAVSLIAGWVSSIRANTGLGIAASAVLVLLLRRWPWWRTLPALALLVTAYISINAFVIGAVRANRERWLAVHDPRAVAVVDKEGTAHTLWHTAYMGIGYLPNRFGLFYSDSVPEELVHREAPSMQFLSARYEAVVRRAYLRFVRDHPLEVIRQYAAKALGTAGFAARYLLLVVLTMPAMLSLGPGRRTRWRWVIVTLPALFVLALPPMVAIPNYPFDQGMDGVIGMLGILGLCWALERLEVETRRCGGLRVALAGMRASWSASGGRRDQARRSLRISGAALVVLAATVGGGHLVHLSAARWQEEQIVKWTHSRHETPPTPPDLEG